MSSKFCLRKRGFWKKFLQKRYVKIKTLFYSSGSKNVTKKCRMDQEKLFFLVWMFSVKIYIPSNLDQRKKGDINEMIINNNGTWKLSAIGRHECPYNNLFKHTN